MFNFLEKVVIYVEGRLTKTKYYKDGQIIRTENHNQEQIKKLEKDCDRDCYMSAVEAEASVLKDQLTLANTLLKLKMELGDSMYASFNKST